MEYPASGTIWKIIMGKRMTKGIHSYNPDEERLYAGAEAGLAVPSLFTTAPVTEMS